VNGWSRSVLVAALALAAGLPRASWAEATPLALAEVSHALDGRMLVVSGRVVNRAATPVAGLVVDVAGYAPDGDPVFLAADGIPWGVPAGGREGFTARIPVTDRPVRVYTIQVALARAPRSALASLRAAVQPWAYRPLLAQAVRVKGSVRGDTLTVQAEAGQWPVWQVTVEATISVPTFEHVNTVIVAPRNTDTVIVQVPAGGAATTRLENRHAVVLGLRVIDAQPLSAWAR
jgi:hypothetical protein